MQFLRKSDVVGDSEREFEKYPALNCADVKFENSLDQDTEELLNYHYVEEANAKVYPHRSKKNS